MEVFFLAMLGTVLFGINNIYTVRTSDKAEYLCRIKGKVLKGCENVYNPITAGDRVEFEDGLITALVKRRNAFTRWNRKRFMQQIIAANLDILFCVTAPSEPPFRPRFLDKVIANACGKYADGYEVVLVLNKCDLGIGPDVAERLEVYRSMGYRVLKVSARTGETQWWMKASRLRVRGTPSTRASMLAEKFSCREVCLYRLFSTTLATASRLSTITSR